LRFLSFLSIIMPLLLFSSPLVNSLDASTILNCLEAGEALPGFFPFPSHAKESRLSLDVSPLVYFGDDFGKTKVGWFVIADPPWENAYLYERTPPMLNVKLEWNLKRVSLYTEFALKNNYNFFYQSFATNVPPIWEAHLEGADLNFPYTACLLYDDEDFYVVVGRSKTRWGSSDFPVALSDVSPCFNHFTFSTRGMFAYTFQIVSINPVLTKVEWEKQTSLVPVNADPTSPYTEKVKTLVTHRLDVSPLRSLRIGFGELTMVGGKVPDLFSISPLAIWHNNYNEGYTNTMFSVDFSWVPFRGFELHGEFVLDDLVGKTELGEKPTAYAFNVGVRKGVDTPLGKVLLGIEFAKANEFVYNTFLPYLKFYNRIVYVTNHPQSRTIVDYPIGFAFGPDASALNFSLDFIGKDLTLCLDVCYLSKGPNTFHTEYPRREEGETKSYWSASLKGKYRWLLFSVEKHAENLMFGVGFSHSF